MRISDWSSDVCSSDLEVAASLFGRPRLSSGARGAARCDAARGTQCLSRQPARRREPRGDPARADPARARELAVARLARIPARREEPDPKVPPTAQRRAAPRLEMSAPTEDGDG